MLKKLTFALLLAAAAINAADKKGQGLTIEGKEMRGNAILLEKITLDTPLSDIRTQLAKSDKFPDANHQRLFFRQLAGIAGTHILLHVHLDDATKNTLGEYGITNLDHNSNIFVQGKMCTSTSCPCQEARRYQY